MQKASNVQQPLEMIDATDALADREGVRHGSHKGSVDEDNFDHRSGTRFLKTLKIKKHGEKHANDVAGAPELFRTSLSDIEGSLEEEARNEDQNLCHYFR